MDFLFLANVALSVMLAISGVAKLRDRASTVDAIRALRLSPWLVSAGVAILLPLVELALAVSLLATWGSVLVISSVAALILMLAYTVVIGRALGFDEPVRCGCFGSLGSGDVDRATLVRNILLTALAALALLGSILGVSLYGQPSSTWGWLAIAALSAAAAALSLGGAETVGGNAETGWLAKAHLIAPDGATVRLGELAKSHGGAVLVFLLPGCGACHSLVSDLPELRRQHPERLIIPVLPHRAEAQAYPGLEGVHRDPGSNIAAALGVRGAPAALQIGPDGSGRGGLVAGRADILELLGGQVEVEAVPEEAEPQELDYVRRPIPDAVLLDGDGVPKTLNELAAERPQLLVAIDALGSPARAVVEQLPHWQAKLPILDVRLIVRSLPDEGALSPAQERAAQYDHGGLAGRALRLSGPVSAVLLGADGMLAGGPVSGPDEVATFVGDIAAEVADALGV